MKVFILILVFTGIALVETPGILKQKLWGELATLSILLTIGFTLSLLQIMEIKAPNPNDAIASLIKFFILKDTY